MMLDSGIDGSLVKDAIADEPIDAVSDLGQQRRDLGRVLLMALRHRGGDNPTLGIHPDMQFLPALGLLLAVFLAVPFPLTIDLQAGAVYDQGYRFLRGTIDLLLDRYRDIASRQRGVIRAGKRQAHQ